MSVPETQRSSDALARLRIKRSEEQPRPASKRRGWRVLGVLVLLVPLLLLGVWLVVQSGWADAWLTVPDAIRPRVEVRVAAVTVETGRSGDALVVATGYLESRRQAKIGARAPGRIETVNVEEGNRVKQGETLAVLEHHDLVASLEATRATVARAKAELGEQSVEIARTERDFARAEALFKQKVMTDAEYDTAKYQHQSAVARRDSMQAAIDLAEARVREAEQLKENMFIRAPFDGTVISKDAEVGESILPGGMGDASGRGSVVTLADLEHLEVDCDVKEDYIARVKLGQSAEVAVDAVPDHRYQGRVRKVIPMGDRARATIKVKVEILNADERLFPEMSSTVYFLPPDDEAHAVEAQARRIFTRRAAVVGDDTGRYVWLVDDKDRLQKVTVEVGAEQDERAEIISGLSGGERVVLNPPDGLRSGQLAKIAE